MSAVTIALVGSAELAAELGKKGTVSDLTLYHAVRDGHAMTIVVPSQYPEKFAPLLYAVAMADEVLLVAEALSRPLAESLAVAELFAKPTRVVLGPAVGEPELRRALKGSDLESVGTLPLEPARLRTEAEAARATPREGPARVRIDHAFPVKGVGAVALGLVTQGTLLAHEKMRLYPDPRTVEVRSIQVHDVDVKEARSGERVGVALRGVEADELSRGQTLAAEGGMEAGTRLTAERWTPCRYYRATVHDGTPLHALVGLQFVPARVTLRPNARLELDADRPVAWARGDPVFVADLDASPGPRIVGRAVTAE